MRLLASLSCLALAFLGGCILVYDPGEFQIADGAGGDGGTGGPGGGGGVGGGQMCSPQDALSGIAVTAQENVWTWIDVPSAQCRDGSATGFGIRINPKSTKLMIFFAGPDGACFNPSSCTDNAGAVSFDVADFVSLKNTAGNLGIFDTTNMDNPVRDWNAVFIPYCTGDRHTGNRTGNVKNGPQGQLFVGFANVGHYMERIVPTFPNLTDVLVTGVSAGGFGALYNYDRIARDFCPVPVTLIDDSGPPMSSLYIASCLQQRWRDLWGVDGTLPQECLPAIGQTGDIVKLITCLGSKYPTRPPGIISPTEASNNTLFHPWGQTDCMFIDAGVPAPAMAAAKYTEGLSQLRNVFLKAPTWSSYYVTGTDHTFLLDRFYTTTVPGVPLTTWVSNMVNGPPAGNIGP